MALVYGLDTGSWKLRLAAMEGSFGRFTLRDVQEVAVLPDQGGGVPLADALKALSDAEPRWADGERAVALPLTDGVVRLVKLPFVDKTAIARAVPGEVEAQVPYDLEDMVLATKLVDARDGQSRTAVHIAPREAVQAHLETMRQANAEPRYLCLDVAALGAYSDRGVQVVLDIGHSRTLVAVCQQGQLLAGRLVPEAGGAVTRAIATAGNVEMEAAEAYKHGFTLPVVIPGTVDVEEDTEATVPPSGPPTVEGAIVAEVERQIALVRAELIAIEDELGLGVDEVLLAGGGSRLGGLSDRISARLGVPVRPVVVPGGYPLDCALAVALGRVATGELKVPDLRIDEFAYHGASDLLWTIVSASTLAAGVALVAGAALFGMRWYDAQDRLAEVQAKVIETVTGSFPDVPADRLTDGSTALAIMQERAAATQVRVDKLGSVVSGLPPTLDMLKTLSERVPRAADARIDVRELTIAEDTVMMKAETDSYETAAKIETALKNDPRFKDARKADEKKTGEALTFSVTIPLGGTDAATAGEEG